MANRKPGGDDGGNKDDKQGLPALHTDTSPQNQAAADGCRKRLATVLSDDLHLFIKSELEEHNVPHAVIINTVTELMVDVAADMAKQCGMEKWANHFTETIADQLSTKLLARIRNG